MRHSWLYAYRDQYRTFHVCARCGMTRITHHEGERFPWTTYHDRDGCEVHYAATPPCDGGEDALRQPHDRVRSTFVALP